MKKIIIKICILIGTVFICLSAALLIVLIHVLKFFRSVKIGKDAFGDSRRHPLNSPEALRG
ncbi:MAG: hypothetical protein HQL24_01430 [Candidatus Omnitrophica bacterium]|nr:hypothetical protein [Candidatus Omnitrophota bacterium]